MEKQDKWDHPVSLTCFHISDCPNEYSIILYNRPAIPNKTRQQQQQQHKLIFKNQSAKNQKWMKVQWRQSGGGLKFDWYLETDLLFPRPFPTLESNPKQFQKY